jgi:hypothetical protein
MNLLPLEVFKVLTALTMKVHTSWEDLAGMRRQTAGCFKTPLFMQPNYMVPLVIQT